MKLLLIFVVSLAIVGCHMSEPVSTDLSTYIATQVQAITGKPIAAPAVSALANVKWERKEDSRGVKIIVQGDHFDAVNEMFLKMLGKPSDITTNELGFPYVDYSVRQYGVCVSYDVRNDMKGYPKSVFIIILKPIKM